MLKLNENGKIEVVIYCFQQMEIKQPDKQYHSDHSIVYSCQYHVVFCPKYRRKVLTGELILEKQSDYGYIVLEEAYLENQKNV